MSKIVAGAGLSIRAIASLSGGGHPLLFAIISYCGWPCHSELAPPSPLIRLHLGAGGAG
jgi:hypothetical protein